MGHGERTELPLLFIKTCDDYGPSFRLQGREDPRAIQGLAALYNLLQPSHAIIDRLLRPRPVHMFDSKAPRSALANEMTP